MDSITQAVGQFFVDANATWSGFLGALTAIGFLSMAIIETLKNMFPVRNQFQSFCLNQWLAAHQKIASERFVKLKRPVSMDEAKADLLTLAVNGNAGALFDLPIEQLCGQLNAAIRVALDYPCEHFSLLAIAAARAPESDMALILSEGPAPIVDPDKMTAAELKERSRFVDARNRVTQQVQRAVDAFQISTGFRWKFWMQVASFVLPALIALIALKHAHVGKGALLLTALVAGFIAPVAHDVLVVIQRLRRS